MTRSLVRFFSSAFQITYHTQSRLLSQEVNSVNQSNKPKFCISRFLFVSFFKEGGTR